LGGPGDANCGVYAVKWLRKRRNGKFFNYDKLDLDREPGPENADDVIVGPSSAFRAKATGYKSAWTGGRQVGAVSTRWPVITAVMYGFRQQGGVQKFSRDDGIDYWFSEPTAILKAQMA
jgi:hypothetical protein